MPLQSLTSKDFMEGLANIVISNYQKTTRNQISLTKISMLGTELQKLLVLIYRILVLIRKGIGIKWRKVIDEETLKKIGQDAVIKTEFNTTNFIKLFAGGRGEKKRQKRKGRHQKEKPAIDVSNIDTIQDFINQPGHINVAGFDTEEQALSLYAELFKDKLV